jgi:hypothetical protein
MHVTESPWLAQGPLPWELKSKLPPRAENLFMSGMIRFQEAVVDGERLVHTGAANLVPGGDSQDIDVDFFSGYFPWYQVLGRNVFKNYYLRLSSAGLGTLHPTTEGFLDTSIYNARGRPINSDSDFVTDDITISLDFGERSDSVACATLIDNGRVNGLSIVGPKCRFVFRSVFYTPGEYMYKKNGLIKTDDFHTEIDVNDLEFFPSFAGTPFDTSRLKSDFLVSGNNPDTSLVRAKSNKKRNPNAAYTHVGAKVRTSALWYTPPAFTHSSTPASIPMLKSRLNQEAKALDRFYGFKPDGPTYSLNKFGKNEKWLRDAAGYYFFIHGTNKALYRYKSGNASTFLTGTNSTFIAFLPPEYYADPVLLISSWPRESNLERVIKFKSANKPVRLTVANDQLNAQGYREKWFKVGTQFYFVVPNGSILKWDGSVKTTDLLTTFPRNSELILTAGKELYYNLEYLF